jgi:hypothetical protein
MFYSQDEFNSQMEELLEKGWSYTAAYAQVRANEQADEEEYTEWRNRQDVMIAENDYFDDYDFA